MHRDIRFSKGKVNTCSVYENDNEDDFFWEAWQIFGKNMANLWQIVTPRN